MPACRTGFASSFRPNETKARPRPKCEATWVGSNCVATVRFSTEKSFRMFGDHLPKCVNVHYAALPRRGATIALREPGRPEAAGAGGISYLRAGAVETGTAEREAGEGRGFRAFTVTETTGESGSEALLAI